MLLLLVTTVKPNFDIISIHSCDETTSGFGKRTAAILEFYFRFRFWYMCMSYLSCALRCLQSPACHSTSTCQCQTS